MKTERLLHESAVLGERKALSDTSDVFVLPSQLLWAECCWWVKHRSVKFKFVLVPV